MVEFVGNMLGIKFSISTVFIGDFRNVERTSRGPLQIHMAGGEFPTELFSALQRFYRQAKMASYAMLLEINYSINNYAPDYALEKLCLLPVRPIDGFITRGHETLYLEQGRATHIHSRARWQLNFWLVEAAQIVETGKLLADK